MRSRVAVALLLVSLLLMVSAPMFAQSTAGVAGISGVVRDPSGAVVPGAKVVISSEGQGTLRTLTTNQAGVFTAPALIPGPGYKVTVTATGFSGYEAAGLVLAVGRFQIATFFQLGNLQFHWNRPGPPRANRRAHAAANPV